MPDLNFDDARGWIDRIWNDTGSHSVFADAALKVRLAPNLRRSDYLLKS